MNEPEEWSFLCIWYESRGGWVHEVKRRCLSFYMAFCIPILLRQRTSRVCQELQHFCRVLTSFVPPVHNQGVCLAPLQGHALWKIFLPTTGSFFVLSLTDLSCMIPGRRLAADVFPTRSSCLSAFLSRLNSALNSIRQKLNSTGTGHCLFGYHFLYCLCRLHLRPLDVSHQFQRVIVHTFCQYRVEYP